MLFFRSTNCKHRRENGDLKVYDIICISCNFNSYLSLGLKRKAGKKLFRQKGHGFMSGYIKVPINPINIRKMFNRWKSSVNIMTAVTPKHASTFVFWESNREIESTTINILGEVRCDYLNSSFQLYSFSLGVPLSKPYIGYSLKTVAYA